MLKIIACLTAIQALFLATKLIVFRYTEETLFSRSVVTLLSMLTILIVMIVYCRASSIFPSKFGLPYIVATAVTAVFFTITLFFIRKFTPRNLIMLFYASIVTPVFEELLFRGIIWSKLNQLFDKEWKTYLTVTILFSLWHIGYAIGLYLWNGGSLLHIIFMKVAVGAVFGVITGAARYKTKNCYPGILIHGILNSIS